MRTTKLSDECGIRQTSINTDVLVNQDGDRVVVNSGRMTLTMAMRVSMSRTLHIRARLIMAGLSI